MSAFDLRPSYRFVPAKRSWSRLGELQVRRWFWPFWRCVYFVSNEAEAVEEAQKHSVFERKPIVYLGKFPRRDDEVSQ